MKVYVLVLLSCLSLLFIPEYSDLGTVGASNGTSSQSNTTGASNGTSSQSNTTGASNGTSSQSNTTGASNGTSSQSNTTGASNGTSSEQYRKLLEKQYFKTGNSLFDKGNYTDAISYYDKALQI